MSIEALIQAHTEALLANTEAVKLLTLAVTGNTPKKGDDNIVDAVVADLKKADSKVTAAMSTPDDAEKLALAEKASTDEAQEAIDKEQDEKTDPVQYETVRALVLKLAPTQREKIKALNAGYGLTNAKDMLSNPDDFTSVKDQAKLEAYYADLQALEG